MRLLFAMDKQDHDDCTHEFVRNSARAIILRGRELVMIYSAKYDYYKFPGGGIEAGEAPQEALLRETREEAGLRVLPGTVGEYGYVHRVQRDDLGDPTVRFVQDNFYYLCDTEEGSTSQTLDDYEAEEGFTPVLVTPEQAIAVNRLHDHGDTDADMLTREARVLALLLAEGYFEETPASAPCAKNDYRIIPYESAYRDDLLFMVLQAKDALGRKPRLNEDLLDVGANYLAKGDGFWLAVDTNDRVIGCVGYSRAKGTSEAFLHRLYVKASEKRKGIGTALLLTAEDAMRRAGIATARVHLGEPEEQWHESYAFYPKNGYTAYAPRYMEKAL